LTAADEVSDSDLDDVTSSQLAVDCEIEHRSVALPAFVVEPESNGPDLLWLQRTFRANHSARVPRAPLFGRRIIL
jgi:hypothetical protein